MADQRSRRRPTRRATEPAGEPEVTVEESAPAPARSSVCPVALCPVGMALTVGTQLKPEVVEHLLAAGRELLLAMRAVIDTRLEGGVDEARSTMERISIE